MKNPSVYDCLVRCEIIVVFFSSRRHRTHSDELGSSREWRNFTDLYNPQLRDRYDWYSLWNCAVLCCIDNTCGITRYTYLLHVTVCFSPWAGAALEWLKQNDGSSQLTMFAEYDLEESFKSLSQDLHVISPPSFDDATRTLTVTLSISSEHKLQIFSTNILQCSWCITVWCIFQTPNPSTRARTCVALWMVRRRVTILRFCVSTMHMRRKLVCTSTA